MSRRTKDKCLAFQYDLRHLKSEKRKLATRNCKNAHCTQPTHLDEFIEFRDDKNE